MPHTTVVYDSPLSAESADQPDQTQAMPPISVAATGGATAEPNEPAEAGRKKKRRWPWLLVGLVVLLGGGYVGAAFATQDSLPATLTVEGVDVSGLSVEEAAPRLEEAFAERAQREILVTVENQEAILVPAESGYRYDVDATLDDLTDQAFNPMALWAESLARPTWQPRIWMRKPPPKPLPDWPNSWFDQPRARWSMRSRTGLR